MCGRYNFSKDPADEKTAALISMMERKYPGEYKTGEIFPGDTAPGIIERQGKIVPAPSGKQAPDQCQVRDRSGEKSVRRITEEQAYHSPCHWLL